MEQPKGILTDSVYQTVRLLADSPAFRRRVKADTAVESEARIKRYDYEEDPRVLRDARPFAVVLPIGRRQAEGIAGGAQLWQQNRGVVIVRLTDHDRDPKNRDASADDFAGWIDEVLSDLVEQLGVDDRIAGVGCEIWEPPTHSPSKDDPSAGAYWWADLLITWRN